MPAAWVSAGVGLLGALNASDAQDAQQQQASQSAADARSASQAALDFDKQKYADSKPTVDALNQQAIQTNAQQQKIAADTAARATQAWEQNQQISAPAATQVGLSSLGSQYLSPEQQKELLGLQQTLGQSDYDVTPGTSTPASGGLSPQEQQRLAQLQQLQSQKTTGPTGPAAGGDSGGPDVNGKMPWEGGYMPTPSSAAPAASTASAFTPALAAELKALQDKSGTAVAGTTTGPTSTLNQKTVDAKKAAQARLQELQNIANQSAQQRELDKAGLITGTAKKFGDQEIALGEEAAQSGLADADTMSNLYRTTAQQRANDFEGKANTQANAAIASSADQADRQLLRLGGDPNKMAAMAADTANGQQLARIGAGNQIAATNIASLNAADDKAFGIKSAALDAARAARTGAKQAALGLNLTGAQQSDTLTGNARDTADAKLNSLAQGGANMALGFANTSGQNAQTSINGGTAGVNNLNTGANGGNAAAALVNGGASAVNTASGIGLTGAQQTFNNANTGASTVAKNIGQATAGLMDAFKGAGGSNSPYTPTNIIANVPGSATNDSSRVDYENGMDQMNSSRRMKHHVKSMNVDAADYPGEDGSGGEMASSKKIKKDVKKMNVDDVAQGLADAPPRTYQYKPGKGKSGDRVGPIAEEMHAQFGDAVAPGGVKLDRDNVVGLHHAALASLHNRVKKLEKRKGA